MEGEPGAEFDIEPLAEDGVAAAGAVVLAARRAGEGVQGEGQGPIEEQRRQEAFDEVLSALGSSKGLAEAVSDMSRQAVAEHYDSGNVHLESLSAESARFGCVPGHLARLRRELAAASLLVFASDTLHSMSNIADTAEQSGYKLRTFSEVMKYDETPMRTRTQDKEGTQALDAAIAVLGKHITLPLGSNFDNGPQKVLFGTRAYSMLLQKDSVFVLMVWKVPLWHVSMEGETANTFYDATQRTRLSTEGIARRFERKQRLCTTDGASAIGKVESALQFDMKYADFHFLHTKCTVHRFANCYSTGMSFLPEDISALVHASLALQDGSSMVRFRRALRNIISERLERITDRAPPAHCAEHRASFLNMFFRTSSRRDRLRSVIVQALANGDWSQEVVQHYCPAGCCGSHQETLDKFCGFLVRALCPTAPPTYPRDSWVGQAEALDWIGGLQCVHGLFLAALRRVSEVEGEYPGHELADDAARGVGGPQGLRGSAGGGEGQGQAEGMAAQAEDRPIVVAGEQQQFQRGQQSQSRMIALRWFSSGRTDGCLVALRRIAEIHRVVMKTLLYCSGEAFESKQRYAEHLRETAGETAFASRAFRGLLLAEHEPVDSALRSCRDLLTDTKLWEALPGQDKNTDFKLELFKVVSAYFCVLSELRTEFEGYPMKLFLLLRNADLAATIEGEPCRHDPFTASFVSHWSERGGIASQGALNDLRSTLLQASWDIVAVEVSHSRLRRTLVGSSTQTHTMSLPDASALELLRSFRKLKGNAQTGKAGAKRGLAHEPPEPTGQPESKRQRPGGGGPWRAFVSDMIRSGACRDLSKMSDLYPEAMLDPDKRAHYQALGSLATQHHREGGKLPFGPSARGIQRASAKVGAIEVARSALSSSSCKLWKMRRLLRSGQGVPLAPWAGHARGGMSCRLSRMRFRKPACAGSCGARSRQPWSSTTRPPTKGNWRTTSSATCGGTSGRPSSLCRALRHLSSSWRHNQRSRLRGRSNCSPYRRSTKSGSKCTSDCNTSGTACMRGFAIDPLQCLTTWMRTARR